MLHQRPFKMQQQELQYEPDVSAGISTQTVLRLDKNEMEPSQNAAGHLQLPVVITRYLLRGAPLCTGQLQPRSLNTS